MRLGSLGPVELLLIVVAIVLIFGASKIGDIGGALGKSIKEFKKASTYLPAGEPDVTASMRTPDQLTPREHEVLRLLAQGQTDREIARSLTVSVGTVKLHVEHLLARLGVSDRARLPTRAVELGLLGKHPG